jgi:hypothetical protein
MFPPKKAILPSPIHRRDGRLLYFAYGSNLNIDAMKRRCPESEPLYALTLADSLLVFRGVADVIYRRNSSCLGGVWSITRECEHALDRYEGVKQGMYIKRYFSLRMKNGQVRPVLFYKMREQGICPPSLGYLQVIEQGYADFELDTGYLEAAVNYAWLATNLTQSITRRYHRKNYDKEFGQSLHLGNSGK